MTGESRWLAVRDALDRHAGLLVAVALVVAAAGGVVTYDAHATEETRTETRELSSWESTAGFEHRATVVESNTHYEAGSVLSNRQVYFRSLTPVLNGSFAYGYAAASGSLDTAVDLRFVSRSVSEDRQGGTTEYWRTERSLAGESGSLSPDDRLSVPFSVNVTAAALRAERFEREVGGTPGRVELLVLADVELSGTRNGDAVDRTRTYRLPVTTEQGIYRVDDPGSVAYNDTLTEQVLVPVRPGPTRAYGGPLLLLVGLAGLGAVIGGRATGRLALSPDERERLAHRRTREEFDEWITVAREEIRVPETDAVALDSLSGLVDLAIDTGERVVETPSGRYVVRHDGQAYTYAAPAGGGDPGAGTPSERADSGTQSDGRSREPSSGGAAGDPAAAGDDATADEPAVETPSEPAEG